MSKLSINNVLLIEQIKKMKEERINYVIAKAKDNIHIVAKRRFYEPGTVEQIIVDVPKKKFCEDLNGQEKLLLMSNMLFPEDEKFCEYCLSAGLDIKFFEGINNIIEFIKENQKKKCNQCLKSSKIIKLNNFTNLNYGLQNSVFVVNKANQIIVQNPKLLIKK